MSVCRHEGIFRKRIKGFCVRLKTQLTGIGRYHGAFGNGVGHIGKGFSGGNATLQRQLIAALSIKQNGQNDSGGNDQHGGTDDSLLFAVVQTSGAPVSRLPAAQCRDAG